MLLVSHKVVFIENEAVLLWATMRKHIRAFVLRAFFISNAFFQLSLSVA